MILDLAMSLLGAYTPGATLSGSRRSRVLGKLILELVMQSQGVCTLELHLGVHTLKGYTLGV